MKNIVLLNRTYDMAMEITGEDDIPLTLYLHQLVQEAYDQRKFPKTRPATCDAVACPQRRKVVE